MKLTGEFPILLSLMERMGAKLSDWRLNGGDLDPLEVVRRELEKGIEINAAEVEVVAGGLLTYKGQHVVLYIKDTRKSRYTLENEKQNSPRFHLWDCQTLQKMKEAGRQERYVVTQRTDGLFPVVATDPDTRRTDELEAELGPCKNCLASINYKGYAAATFETKEELWDRFNLNEYFAEFSTFFSFKPSRTDRDVVGGYYVQEWDKISRRIRSDAGWICDSCGVNLTTKPNLLHCHHRNGDVRDNNRSNIEVLCIMCHAAKPLHGHLKPNAEARLSIATLRRAQGLSSA